MHLRRPLLPRTVSTAVFASVVAFGGAARAQQPPAPPPDPSPAPPPTDPAPAPPAVASGPVAGYHNGLFYLRDPSDTFRLYVQGRVHVDFLDSIGPGIPQLPASQA